jgi:excisionase family DNA binding protein
MRPAKRATEQRHRPLPQPNEGESAEQDSRPRPRRENLRPEGLVVNGNGRSRTTCRKERTLQNHPRTRPGDRLLTAAEVADILALPESWVREATRAGRLPHLKLGRYRRYSRQAIEAWLEEQQAGPPPTAQRKRPDLHSDPESSL